MTVTIVHVTEAVDRRSRAGRTAVSSVVGNLMGAVRAGRRVLIFPPQRLADAAVDGEARIAFVPPGETRSAGRRVQALWAWPCSRAQHVDPTHVVLARRQRLIASTGLALTASAAELHAGTR